METPRGGTKACLYISSRISAGREKKEGRVEMVVELKEEEEGEEGELEGD